MIELEGRPIVITGASSGIGRATAIACAGAGMPVVLGARREDRLRAVAEEIGRAGGRAVAQVADVSRDGEAERLVERAEREFGGLYAVFANAGYGLEGPILSTPEPELRAIFETNFWGTLRTVRPAVERMRAHGRGHVLICTSALSKISMPLLSAYSATKAAQDHIGRGMRHELAREGIFVSTVHPIGTATEFSEALSARAGRAREAAPPIGMIQGAEVVARAVVRCLRRPRGEVWTYLPARLAMAAALAFPGVADALLARRSAR